MKINIFLFLLITVSYATAQKATEEIDSRKLGEKREITVITPASYEFDKEKKYPLLLLLDGDYLADPFAGTLAYTAYWDDLPEVIIVGISQNKKSEREADCAVNKDTGLPEGKADAFFEFIGTELLPYIEKKYRTGPFRIIAGHNITAAYLNFFLYKEQPLFNAYISMSPELAIEMENRIPERLAALKSPVYYYLATANGDVNRLQKKIKTLNENIKATTAPNIKYQFDEFKGASHYSLVTFAVPNALYHIFSSYQPISSVEYQEKLAALPSGHAAYVEDKYKLIEKDFGVKMPIRLNDLRVAEAAILKNGAYDELRGLADLARKSYPKTIIGEYYSGMYYEMTGNTSKAIKTYMNSYTLSEIGEYTKDFMLKKAEMLK